MREGLLNRYVAAAESHGRATESGDSELANRSHDEIVSTYREIRFIDPDLVCLVPLLRHANPTVQVWAASHLLDLGNLEAEQTLKKLSTSGGLAGLAAEMVLAERICGD